MPGAERGRTAGRHIAETQKRYIPTAYVPFRATKGDACERSKHAGVCPGQSGSSNVIPAPTLRHSCAGRNPHRPLRFSVRGRECSAAKRAGDARGGAGQNRRSPHRRNPKQARRGMPEADFPTMPGQKPHEASNALNYTTVDVRITTH